MSRPNHLLGWTWLHAGILTSNQDRTASLTLTESPRNPTALVLAPVLQSPRMTGRLQRVEHVWQRRHTPEVKQLIRYTMVSVISTAVSFAVLGIVFGALHLWGEVVSTMAANIAGTIPTYFLLRQWVWGKGGRSHVMKEIVPFWIMSALGIAVSIGGAALARNIGIRHHFSHPDQTLLVLFANLVSFGVFWVLKYLLYNRLFHVHPVEELDERVELLVAGGPIPVPELAFDQWSAPWTSVHPWLPVTHPARSGTAPNAGNWPPPVGHGRSAAVAPVPPL